MLNSLQNTDFGKGFDNFRSFVLSFGDRFPELVTRWANLFMCFWLVGPHKEFWVSPPSQGLLSPICHDLIFGWLMGILAASSWGFSILNLKKGTWATSVISLMAWTQIVQYLWISWFVRGGDLLSLHYFSVVFLFSSFFVPLRLSSERRKIERPTLKIA